MSNTSNTAKSQSSRNSPERESRKESETEPKESKEPTESQEEPEEEPQEESEEDTPRKSSSRSRRGDRTDSTADDQPSPMEVLRQARGQLEELTGMVAESVSSFERTEDGWSLEIEVLELTRVPDTMSLLASYQVDLDARGALTGYRRVRRYERGRSDARRSSGR